MFDRVVLLALRAECNRPLIRDFGSLIHREFGATLRHLAPHDRMLVITPSTNVMERKTMAGANREIIGCSRKSEVKKMAFFKEEKLFLEGKSRSRCD